MLKQGLALPQAQFALLHGQQAAGVQAILPVKDRSGGRVVAGIQSQNRHAQPSVCSVPARSGLGGVSWNSARTKLPKMPFTKETTSLGS